MSAAASGPKNNFNPEELAIAALSMKLNRPLRWIEDRREHLIASPHAREHRYELTAYADEAGRILGLEAEVVVDAGAYSVWPWTASMEAGMSAGIMTGPYDIAVYHARAISVATNKSPLGPYRGVGRSGACFAIETLVDAVARAVGREPADVRILKHGAAARRCLTNPPPTNSTTAATIRNARSARCDAVGSRRGSRAAIAGRSRTAA